jgi:site-specific recombinase XerD
MPADYILMGHCRVGEMARRLMERESLHRYREMALRLGYSEATVRRQFGVLVYLMAWSQKGMDALDREDIDAFFDALRRVHRNQGERHGTTSGGLPGAWSRDLMGTHRVLSHLGVVSSHGAGRKGNAFSERKWAVVAPRMRDTVRRYLQQLALVRPPGSLAQEDQRLWRFFSWLARAMPEVTSISQIRRCHIEAFKEHLRWASPHPRFHRSPGSRLSKGTVASTLSALLHLFSRIAQWGWEDAPAHPLILQGDLPPRDDPRPRFLDEVEAAHFLQAARSSTDLFTRVCGVTLLRTGLRVSEFLGLTADGLVCIGDGHWLRIPPIKTRRERYVPLHPEVKDLLEEWLSHHPPLRPADLLFTQYGRRIGRGKAALAVQRIAEAARISTTVTPHRLRHTLATLAINRGMTLESIAALLGHRSLSMTLVYARIGRHTLEKEYSSVSQQLQHLCGAALPSTAEGDEMRKLRKGSHWRMLGNGYCTRPEGVPCEYEAICETCPAFLTTSDFLPILHKQEQDAEEKAQTQRAQMFHQLITRAEGSQSFTHPPLDGLPT